MRFPVVGCGSIGKRHLRNLKLLSAGELVAYDTREDRREELRYYERAITLPLFPGMSDEDVEDVIKAVQKVLVHYRTEVHANPS